MLNKSLLSLCCITTFLALPAHADESLRWPNWYVGLHGGVNFYDSDNSISGPMGNLPVEADNGYILGLSVGYKPTTGNRLLDATRWEVEYSFRSNALSRVGSAPQSGDLLSHTAMANLLLDFENPTIFTPYIGAGYGLSEYDFDGDDETGEAWQLLLGVDYAPLTKPGLRWGLRYRYLDPQAGGIVYDDELVWLSYENHSVEATAKLQF